MAVFVTGKSDSVSLCRPQRVLTGITSRTPHSSESIGYLSIIGQQLNISQVLVSTPIQLFFAWRIRLLARSNWIAILICIFAFASFGRLCTSVRTTASNLLTIGGGIWTACRLGIIKLFARKPELHTPALVWFLSSCVADVLITGSLVFYLVRCVFFQSFSAIIRYRL